MATTAEASRPANGHDALEDSAPLCCMIFSLIWWILTVLLLFWAPIPWAARYAGVIVLLYFGAVVQFLISVRHPLHPAVQRYDGSDDEVGAADLSYLGRSTLRLQQIGFQPIAELVMKWPPSRGRGLWAQTLGAILDDAAVRSRAWVSSSRMTAPQRSVTLGTVSVASRYADGGIRMTINSPPSRVDPAESERRVCVFLPDITDAATVARVHAALIERDERGEPQPLAPVEDAVELGQRMYHELFVALLEAGHLRRDERHGHYRLTLRGALRLVGRAVPPFSTVRDRRARREAAALLARLGIDAGPPPT